MPTNNLLVFLEKAMQANLFTPLGVIKAAEMAQAIRVNNFPSFGGIEIATIGDSAVKRVLMDRSTLLKMSETGKFPIALDELAQYIKEAAKEHKNNAYHRELAVTPLKFIKEEILKYYLASAIREENSMYGALVEEMLTQPTELSLLEDRSPLVILSPRGTKPRNRFPHNSIIIYVSIPTAIEECYSERNITLLFPHGITISTPIFGLTGVTREEVAAFTTLPTERKVEIVKIIMDKKASGVEALISYYGSIPYNRADGTISDLAKKKKDTLKKAVELLKGGDDED